MTDVAITGARILTADGWRGGHVLIVRGGLIAGIVPVDEVPADLAREDGGGGLLLPGFIDTQVNGGGGVLLNDEPTVEGIATIASTHRRFGTTALLPTLISDDLDVVARAIAAVDDAMVQGVPGVIGIHIEGPFLNREKRGIHDASKIRTIDGAAVELLSSLRNGRTLVTLAPELTPPGFIRRLTDKGVIVAAGHTLATYEDMQRARDEGLTGVTHLFNAMTGLESRAPGVVGAALDSDLYCGLIVDGHHVHPATLRSACRAKGMERLMLVTDAMSTVGTGMTQFTLGGETIHADAEALRASDGTLAGSTLDMATACRNAIAMLHVDLVNASRMASANPAVFLGIDESYGRIAIGQRADLILMDDSLTVQRSWIGGIAD